MAAGAAAGISLPALGEERFSSGVLLPEGGALRTLPNSGAVLGAASPLRLVSRALQGKVRQREGIS